MNSISRATVVGISGVTCGGKTSLTKMLKNMFPLAAVICQDDFFFADSSLIPRSPTMLEQPNWDSIESIDMVKMMSTVRLTIAKLESLPKSLLIIDGFLIFNYPPLAELCDFKFFITLTYRDCLDRRRTRIYDPPDPPGYFQRYVWPMYRRNLREMKEKPYAKEIRFLNGIATLEDNFQLVLKNVQKSVQL